MSDYMRTLAQHAARSHDLEDMFNLACLVSIEAFVLLLSRTTVWKMDRRLRPPFGFHSRVENRQIEISIIV